MPGRPAVPARRATNIIPPTGTAVRTPLHRWIEAKGTPLYKPVVFFMSDGQHVARESWQPALEELLNQRPSVLNPEVVCFGFGDANMADLQKIATRFAFQSKDVDPVVQVREIMNALISSIRTSSQSFSDPAKADGLHLDVPEDRFVSLEKFTL